MMLHICNFTVDQILTHSFATMLLSLRYSIREAKNCIVLGKSCTVNKILVN